MPGLNFRVCRFAVFIALSLLAVIGARPRLALAATGRTEGGATVTPRGSAAYSIPIWAPKGAGGLGPTIALNYSHDGDNGLQGMGFDISGLPMINRCYKTRAQDNAIASPLLGAGDAYCLDGARLRLVSGNYGLSESTYETEIKTFARITAKESFSDGPTWFKVETKDGLIYEYGHTLDSRIQVPIFQSPRTYGLSSVSDRFGNLMTVKWSNDGANSYRPDEIAWATNSGTTTAPYKIKFVYDPNPRPDPLTFFRFGVGSAETHRLDRIEVQYYNGSSYVVVRQYRMTYQLSSTTNRSRLQQVQECGASTSDCLAPTTFGYQPGGTGWVTTEQTANVANSSSMDIDGDGRDDLLHVGVDGSLYFNLAQSSGGFGPDQQITFTPPRGDIFDWRAVNANGDAFNDLAVHTSLFIPMGGTNVEKFEVFRNTGSGFTSYARLGLGSTANGAFGDFNGDGLDDFVQIDDINPSNVYVSYNTGTGFAASQIFWQAPAGFGAYGVVTTASLGVGLLTKDVNGDGRDDVAVLVCSQSACTPSNRVWQMLLPGATLPAAATKRFPTATGAVRLGDINGDGLVDILSDYGFAYGTGTDIAGTQGSGGTSVLPFLYPSGVTNFVSSEIVDWDSDGRSDLIFPSGTTWWVTHSNGGGFDTPFSTGIPYVANQRLQIGDFDADGLQDIGYGSPFRFRSHVAGGAPDLITQITDGLGRQTQFDYTPLSDTTVYTPGASATFPSATLRSTRPIVKQMRQTDGTSNALYGVSFQYEDGRLDLNGRGFLGFGKRIAVNNAAGYNIRTEEVYRQDFPFIGLVNSAVVKQSNGFPIRETTNSWQALTEGAPFSTERKFPYAATQTVKEYEVGGTNDGQQMRTTTTTNVVDTVSGAVIDQTSTVTEHANASGLNAGQAFTTRTQIPTGFLLNDSTNWCIGRAQRTDVTASYTPGTFGAAQTRRTDTAWTANKCRPNTVTAFPGDAALQVQTTLEYDTVFGNLFKETTTPIGMAARLTQYDYWPGGLRPRYLTNPEGHVTELTWDFSKDVVSARREPSLTTSTSWTYDSFARPIQEVRPDGTKTDWAYLDCASAGGCLNSANKMLVTTTERDTAGATVRDDSVYLDRFERPLVRKERLLNGAYRRTDTEYDSLGRVKRQAEPCWWTSCTYYWNTPSYDLLGRVTSVSRPTSDSDSTPATTTIDRRGLTTDVTDPLSHVKHTIADATGQILSVTDAFGSADVATSTYGWDSFGNLKTLTLPDATQVAHAYNIRGFRTQTTDPDTGTTVYDYFASGDLRGYRDAKTSAPNWTATYTVDRLSRPLTRQESEGTTYFTWGNSAAAHDIGKLASISVPSTGIGEQYLYDGIGRPSQTTYNRGADGSYDVNYDYNNLGTLNTLTYPTSTSSYRLKLQYDYSYGQLNRVKDFNAPTTVYWTANDVNPRDQVTQESLGNGLVTTRGFDAVLGLTKSIQTGAGGNASAQNLTYQWDRIGNLQNRKDVTQNLTEVFSYDNLDRLTSTRVGALSPVVVGYNAVGNITGKSDLGAYTYDAVKKHAVASIATQPNGWSFTYDPNGNMLTGRGQTIAWTSFNKPSSVTQTVATGGGGSTTGPVTWTNVVSATTGANGSFQKIAGNWIATAVSQQAITAGDASFSFQTNVTAAAVSPTGVLGGLNSGDTSTIEYYWNIVKLVNGTVDAAVRVNGVYQTDVVANPGDTFKIAIVGGVVKFYQNATMVYSSTAPIYPLTAYTDTGYDGYGLTQATITTEGGGSGTSGSTTWTNIVSATTGANGSFQKVAGNWIATAVSQQAITAGDGSFSFQTNVTAAAASFTGVLGGLNSGDTSTIEYYWNVVKLVNGTVDAAVRVNGVYQTDVVANPGDTFKIAIVGGVVKFYQNATMVYSSTAPTYPLTAYTDTAYDGYGLTQSTMTTAGSGGGTATVSSQFSYDPYRQYYKQTAVYVDGSSTTQYVGGLLEKVTRGSVDDYRHLINVGGASVIVSRADDGTNAIYYKTEDHLGSSSAITTGAGVTILNSSFDAFGARRGANWQGAPSTGDWQAIASTTRHGFTDHNMLDNLGLIHMNGRVYDSVIGRFQSADPTIPDLYDSQALNPYSYVNNNPLRYTDPSGYGPEGDQCTGFCISFGFSYGYYYNSYLSYLIYQYYHALVTWTSNVPAMSLRMDSSATAGIVRLGLSPQGTAAAATVAICDLGICRPLDLPTDKWLEGITFRTGIVIGGTATLILAPGNGIGTRCHPGNLNDPCLPYGATLPNNNAPPPTGNPYKPTEFPTDSSALGRPVVNDVDPATRMDAKGGKQKGKDSGLINVSDTEISRRARDGSLSPGERRRYQTEEKFRGQRHNTQTPRRKK